MINQNKIPWFQSPPTRFLWPSWIFMDHQYWQVLSPAVPNYQPVRGAYLISSAAKWSTLAFNIGTSSRNAGISIALFGIFGGIWSPMGKGQLAVSKQINLFR